MTADLIASDWHVATTPDLVEVLLREATRRASKHSAKEFVVTFEIEHDTAGAGVSRVRSVLTPKVAP